MGEKKTNALSKSMKLIYVYAMATGAIFTFMCYWDGIFMSYTGPGTFLAFALMTLAVLPTAFVYAEFSTMLPSTGSCLVFNTVGINKHAGFWSAWLIMCAWIAVPAAGVLGIIEWLNHQFGLGLTGGKAVIVGSLVLCHGPHLAVQADGPYGRDGNGRSVLNNCLRLIVDDLAGSELGFELLNDLRMHLLIDLDLEPEHDEAEDDENKRDVEGEGLERGDVGRGHVDCRGMTGHASREGNGTDRTVGHRAADLVEHGTHRQGDRLVAPAVLQLAVLDGVGQRQNRGHLDELRRHIEEDQGDDDDRQVAGEQGEHRVADDHGDHAAGEQVATGNPAVENRVQRRHDESGDQRDDAGDGEGGRLVKHEHEEVVHHTGRDDVCDGVQQVGQGDPQQLVVLEQRLERLEQIGRASCRERV